MLIPLKNRVRVYIANFLHHGLRPDSNGYPNAAVVAEWRKRAYHNEPFFLHRRYYFHAPTMIERVAAKFFDPQLTVRDLSLYLIDLDWKRELITETYDLEPFKRTVWTQAKEDLHPDIVHYLSDPWESGLIGWDSEGREIYDNASASSVFGDVDLADVEITIGEDIR